MASTAAAAATNGHNGTRGSVSNTAAAPETPSVRVPFPFRLKLAAFTVTCMGHHGRAYIVVQDCTTIFVHFARLEMHIMLASCIQFKQN